MPGLVLVWVIHLWLLYGTCKTVSIMVFTRYGILQRSQVRSNMMGGRGTGTELSLCG